MGAANDARSPGARRLWRWLVIAAVGLFAFGVAAQGTAPLRYGGDSDFAPFEWLDGEGRARGFQIELLAELAREIGVSIQPELRPWVETEAAFRAGSLDLVAMVDTPARREWASFLRAHATPAFAIYQLRARPQPQDLQSLAGRRVAVLAGEAMQHTLQAWLGSATADFLPFTDAAAALAAVQEGRADAALLPRAYGDRALAAGGAPEVAASRFSLYLQSYAFAVTPANQALRARLQAGLDVLERDGRLEALRLRWLSSHHGEAERSRLAAGLSRQRQWTWWVAAASGSALLLLGIAAWKRGRRIAAERRRRHAAETALAHAEELLGRAFHHNSQPMLVIERAGGVVRAANAALCALLGVDAEAILGRPLEAQSRHVDTFALQRLIVGVEREGGLDAAPLRVTRADGALRECLVSVETMRIDGQQQAFCIVRDITDELARDASTRAGYAALQVRLDAAQQAAAAARAGQARAENSLQDFTRALAHDLRTPLNAVVGFVGILRKLLQRGSVAEAIECSGHIERAALRMDSMITALASLARVAGATLQRQRIDMAALARETWRLLAAAQPERQGQVECRIDDLPPAQGDPDLAAQVWQNLLDNAWKYSARVAAARVAVDSYRESQRTWYRIADNGAGFEMTPAGTLFQPFQRMHSAQEFAGTGIGLSLVRRIIDHHGGEIRLRSVPGTGTVAEFTLDPQPPAA